MVSGGWLESMRNYSLRLLRCDNPVDRLSPHCHAYVAALRTLASTKRAARRPDHVRCG